MSFPLLCITVRSGLSSTQVLLEAVKRFDESRQKVAVDSTKIIAELKRQVEHGNIELPPIPDIMLKIVTKHRQCQCLHRRSYRVYY